MDIISFGTLYDAVARNEARRLEDAFYAMRVASQGEAKHVKEYVRERLDPVLRPVSETNDLVAALAAFGAGV